MMHSHRVWCLSKVESSHVLAHKLTQHTWTLCSAFFVAGREEYAFLNDATSEDGAGEFAIVKRLPDGSFLQVESVTFSWCDEAQGLIFIEEALAGKYDGYDFVRPVCPVLQTAQEHGRCRLCA
jgi:hypothetical protein